jgi:hypothetical protein
MFNPAVKIAVTVVVSAFIAVPVTVMISMT